MKLKVEAQNEHVALWVTVFYICNRSPGIPCVQYTYYILHYVSMLFLQPEKMFY